jgi:hypothetical protein
VSRIIIPAESIGLNLETLPSPPDDALAQIQKGIQYLAAQGADLRQPIGIDAIGLYVLGRDLLRFRALCRLIDPNDTNLTLLRLRALLPENQTETAGDSNG